MTQNGDLDSTIVRKQAAVSDRIADPTFTGKIRNRLLLHVLGVVGVVLFALAFATYHSSFSLLDEMTEEKSRDEVELAVEKIERWMAQRRSALEVLAHVEERNLAKSHEQQAYFLDVANQFGERAVYFASAEGSVISSDGWEAPDGWDPRSRPWYQAAIASDNSIVTNPYADASPPYQKIITFAAAIRQRGEVRGVIAMDASIDSVLAIVNQLRIGDFSRAYLLFEKDGVVADDAIFGMHSDNEIKRTWLNDFLVSGEKLKVYVDDEYRVFARIADTGMIVALHLPLSSINSALMELTYIFGFGSIAALLVLAFAVSFVSAVIARPILSLADGAKKIAAGDFAQRLAISTKDEIGLVTHRFNFMAEGLQEREVIRSTFGRYVSPEAVREILDGKMELGGEKKLVTVMFCDLRNFTSYAERCDPERLVETLNKYFTQMDAVIRRHGGSINRYLGDGILALFGAPTMLENSASAAAEASLAMVDALQEFNVQQGTEFGLGIGIHTGVALVGNIGSLEHTEYTVIGNVANLAARIEALTKVYGETIVVSEAIAALLPTGVFESKLLDRVRVFGKKDSVTLYALSRAQDADLRTKELTAKIVETYLQGNFVTAAQCILQIDKELRTAHLQLLLERCQELAQDDAGDWDGAYTYRSK